VKTGFVKIQQRGIQIGLTCRTVEEGQRQCPAPVSPGEGRPDDDQGDREEGTS